MNCAGLAGFLYTLTIDSCAHVMKRGYTYSPASPAQHVCFPSVNCLCRAKPLFSNFWSLIKNEM